MQAYLEDKFSEKKLREEPDLNNTKEEVSQSISMDMSRPVDETSLMINDSFNNSMVKVVHNESMDKVLPADIGGSAAPLFKF